MSINHRTALLIIDPQVDFCPGGALAVAEGDAIMPLINRLARDFQNVVISQDWHPADHASFAANHPGRRPFEMTELFYGPQVLWPAHCVIGSPGAAFHPDLDVDQASLIIRKGSHPSVDSYSAFLEADRATKTGLDGYFHARGVTELFICGLATDFCVLWTAEDARHFGFGVTLIEDACRAIDLNGSLAAAWERMAAAGVRRVRSHELQNHAVGDLIPAQ